MRYLLAIICPPLAVLLCGKLIQPFLSLILTLCCWFPGVLHALFVVQSTKAEELQDRLLVAQGLKTPSTGPSSAMLAISGGGVFVLASLAIAYIISQWSPSTLLPDPAPSALTSSTVESKVLTPPEANAEDTSLMSEPSPSVATVKPDPSVSKTPTFPTDSREWTSKDGRKVLGRILSIDATGGTVHLQRADGLDFPSFRLNQLSEEDQTFLLGGGAP